MVLKLTKPMFKSSITLTFGLLKINYSDLKPKFLSNLEDAQADLRFYCAPIITVMPHYRFCQCVAYLFIFLFFFRDVASFSLSDYPRMVQNLICKAHTIGWLMQVNTDGYTPNRRLNLAMGLSSIHIAQLYEVR